MCTVQIFLCACVCVYMHIQQELNILKFYDFHWPQMTITYSLYWSWRSNQYPCKKLVAWDFPFHHCTWTLTGKLWHHSIDWCKWWEGLTCYQIYLISVKVCLYVCLSLLWWNHLLMDSTTLQNTRRHSNMKSVCPHAVMGTSLPAYVPVTIFYFCKYIPIL